MYYCSIILCTTIVAASLAQLIQVDNIMCHKKRNVLGKFGKCDFLNPVPGIQVREAG